MPLASDVTLPRAHVPVFPSRCVRCGGPPTSAFRLTERAVGWWTALFMFGSSFSAEVPACAPCAAAMRCQRRSRFVIMVAMLAAGVAVALQFVASADGMRRWIVGGIALAVAMPWFGWTVFSPPAFDLYVRAETVDYQFRDASYAADFAELNGAKVDDA